MAVEKKSRLNWNAMLLIGIIYCAIGAIFVVLGCLLAFWSSDSESKLVGLIFLGVGGLFLVLGLIFTGVQLARKRRNDALIEAGRYVWAKVESCNPNLLITINHRHPYIATLCHTDGYGKTRRFQSQSLYILDPQPLIGQQVRVWIDPANEKHFYVDMDSLLKKTAYR